MAKKSKTIDWEERQFEIYKILLRLKFDRIYKKSEIADTVEFAKLCTELYRNAVENSEEAETDSSK